MDRTFHIKILSVFLFSALPTGIYAQPPSTQQKTIGKVTATFSKIAVANPAKTKFTRRAQVAVQTDPLPLTGDTRNGLFLTTSFILPGDKVVRPAYIEFEFISYSPKRKFQLNRSFQILSGQENLYSASLLLATSGESADGIVTEVLVAKVPYASFLRLVPKKSLQFVIGDTRIELTEDNLSALSDMKKMIDLSPTFRL